MQMRIVGDVGYNKDHAYPEVVHVEKFPNGDLCFEFDRGDDHVVLALDLNDVRRCIAIIPPPPEIANEREADRG